MRKIFYVILLSFILHGFCYAQIGVPVNFQTGSPSINIPIYEIKNGDISVPISLYYTPGVKISQPYGNDGYNIGTGWGVNAGGQITRSVKSLPDDYQGTGTDTRMGWLYSSGAASVLNFTPQSRTDCSGDVANYNTLNSFATNNTDTEPDVFSFNFGGASGRFMFDNNKVIQTLPYQDLKIQPAYSASGAIASFTITTNNGVQYTFMPTTTITMSVTPGDITNKVYYLRDKLIKYTQPITYTTVWSLSSVNSPSGGSILLSYNLERLDTTTNNNRQSTDIYLANNTALNTMYKTPLFYTNTKTDTKLLSAVAENMQNYPGTNPGNETINFVYGANPASIGGVSNGPTNNINQIGWSLESFTVYSFNTLEKTISLNLVNAGGYLFLQSMHESGNTCAVTPPYEFEYLGITLANGYSPSSMLPIVQGTLPATSPHGLDYCQQDYWGYYNANGATTLVPNLFMYPNEPLQERYRLQQIPGYVGTYNAILGGADRTVNPVAITAGTLYRIIFPTGGSVKIDYEPNQYTDARTNQTFLGGGIRVKTVTLHDGISTNNNIIKNYTYSGGVLLNRPQFAFSIPVYTDFSGTTHTIEEYTDEPTQATFFTALSEDDLNPYTFDSPDVLYQSGTESQVGKGKVVNSYINPATYAQITSSEYASPNQWQATYSQYATTTNPSSGACMSKGMMADGYYNFPYPTNTNYNFERGLLQSVQAFNEGGQLVKETDYQYTPIYQNTAPVSIYGLNYDYFTYNQTDINTKAFAYGKYRLFAAMNKYQATTIEKTYDPGTNFTGFATVETDAFYNSANHTLLSSTQTSASNDGTNFTVYKTKFKYPQDYTVGATIDPATTGLLALQTNFINAAVIEKTSTITKPGQSEQVTGALLNKFNVFSIANPQYTNGSATYATRVLPAQSLVLKTNAPLSDFAPSAIDINNNFKYDARYQVNSNVLEYSFLSNPVSVNDGHQGTGATLYDITGMKPVAFIKNALASQVLYSNFDDEYPVLTTLHSFDVPTSISSSNYSSVSGRIGLGLSLAPNFTFTKSSVNKGPGAYYVLSCWINNPTTVAGSITVTLTDGTHTIPAVLSYPNSTGVWTYCRTRIPVSSLNSTFSINVQTTSYLPLIVDDMLFYPEVAQVTLSGYQNKFKIADTDPFGNSVFYTYDGLGRPTIVTDQNQNILKRTVYNYNSSYALNANFFMSSPANPNFFQSSTANTNTTVNFSNGAVDPCEPAGIIRNWYFGDGATAMNGGNSQTHTYTTPGNYSAELTLTNPQYGTVSTTQNITITTQPTQLAFNLQITGIAAYNVCNQQVIGYGGLGQGSNPLGTDTFTAIVSGSYTNQFLWEQAFNTTPNTWVTLPSTTNTVTVSVPLNSDGTVSSNKSYTVRCTMLPQTGQVAGVSTTNITFLAPWCNL